MAGLTLIFAVLRKELALQLLCIATVAVLARELGWRRALLISGLTIALALLAGGLAHRLIALAVRVAGQ